MSLDSGSSWASVSSGHTAAGAYYVAKKDDGTLWAWGSNDTGQLGHSGVTLTPTQILDTGDHSGHSWTTVSTAKALGSVAALRDDGTLWVWGSNPSGELGVGIDPVVEPTQIIGNWSSVVLNSTADGSNVAILALDADGALYSWGLNADGRLGTGAEYAVLTAPALVDAGPWEKIAAAPNMNVSYGIKNDGTLWSWGIGIDGMAGQGEVENNFLVPTQIAGFNDWVNVVVGDGHIFGQRAGIDFLYAWGNQFRGLQIDPVSPDEHFVPTEVAVWSWSTPTSTVASAFPDGAPFDMQPNHFYLQLNN